MFFRAERPKAARKKRIRVLPNREYPRTTTVDIPGKTASVSYLNAVISGLIMELPTVIAGSPTFFTHVNRFMSSLECKAFNQLLKLSSLTMH